MKREKYYFPWRVFRWFVFYQVFWFFFLLAIFFLIKYIYFETLEDENLKSEKVGDLFVSLLVSFAFSIGITWVMAKKLLEPLGHLVAKTRHLRKFPFLLEELSHEELAKEEEGEWYELESAINQLGRDFRQKTVKLSREKTELRAIMSAVDEAILAVDLQCEPLFYNNRFAFLFRLERWDGKKVGLGEVIRSPEVVEGIKLTTATGEAQQKFIDYILPGTAKNSFFRVSFAPLTKKHNSKLYGTVVVFHDLTSIKASEKMRIDFVANASHELRTPVTSLKGYVQTLQEDLLAGRQDQLLHFVSIIEKNVVRLEALLNDLLDLSQLEMGSEIKKQKISTREITENVLHQVDGRFHQIITTFKVENFFADLARVEQVLRNLIQNALRYVPQGGKIEITWEKEMTNVHEERGVILKVKDSGPGIPEVHLPRLFERFYRIDEGRSRDKGGTGIGLALVKHIMNAHGGSVKVKSRMGEGSEFICQF